MSVSSVHVVAKVHGPTHRVEDTQEALERQGIPTVLDGSYLYAMLKPAPGSGTTEAEIPKELQWYHSLQLGLEAKEMGGKSRETADATVVCRPNGQPMRPFEVANGSAQPCGVHAKFMGTVLITVRSHNGKTTITDFYLTRQGSKYSVTASPLRGIRPIYNTVKAMAKQKAGMPNCKQAIYLEA